MGKYLLGLDNGGSMTKAALFDTDGNEVAVASCSTQMIYPAPGYTERSGDAVWAANVQTIRDVLEKSGVPADQIVGIACCGYGNGMHMIDENGKDTYNNIVSTDTRANHYVAQFNESGAYAKIQKRTFQCIWAAQPIAMLAWFHDHRKEVLEKTRFVLTVTDYIRYKLTGEAYGELTNASGTNTVNLKTGERDIEIFRALGIEEYFDLFPPIRRPDEICGRITAQAAAQTGLIEGTPLSGGLFDIDACCLASGVTDDSKLALIAGTWTINEYISNQIVDDPELFMCSTAYMNGKSLITEASATCAANFNWFIEQFMSDIKAKGGMAAVYDYCSAAVEAIDPADTNIVFLPYIFSSNAHPDAKGTFLNINSNHTRDHMIRAIYEGLVFSSAYHVEKLRKHKKDFSVARMSGGITKSPVWTQMTADVLQMPIEVVKGSELGAMGTAMTAGIACGVFKSYEQAVGSMVSVSHRYEPNKERAAIYAKKFNTFKNAITAVSLFHDLEKK